MDTTNTQLDPKVLEIVKALAQTENGGTPDLENPKAGQSGEMKSIFQFTPGTWKAYSQDILGREENLTPQTEAAVVYGKVNNWLHQGFTPEQIASIWNGGSPDAYLQGDKGVNKYGVKYDVGSYVNKFKSYLNQDENQSQTNPQLISTPTPNSSGVQPNGMLPQLAQNNFAGKQMKQVKQV